MKYDMTAVAQAIEPLGNIHRGQRSHDEYRGMLISERYEIEAQLKKLQRTKRLLRVALDLNDLRNDGFDLIDLAECVRDRRSIERLAANDSSS